MAAYWIEVRHEGLHKYRRITGNDRYVVQQKARAQEALWEEQWAKRLAALAKEEARESAAAARAELKALAEEKTSDAEAVFAEIDRTLAHTLEVNDRIDWEQLKDFSGFPEPEPVPPKPQPRPQEPQPTDFPPAIGFLDRLVRRNVSSLLRHRSREICVAP